jgi:hypothetical protein
VRRTIAHEDITAKDVTAAFYHSGTLRRPSTVPISERYFVAWDGEGMNLSGPKQPQHYVLFGCSTGEHITGRKLGTAEILSLITGVGRRNPAAIHVGFALNYDFNMIASGMHSSNLRKLYKHGQLYYRNGERRWLIKHIPSKFIQITEYYPNYHPRHNNTARCTVKIFDIFTFFMTSFVKAAEAMLGKDTPGMDVVREGKAARNDFTYEEMDYVKRYWTAEIEMVRQVAEELRRRLYGAGLIVKEWYGPGALASYKMKECGIREHAMAESKEEVRKAARYAYAGGRFELFKTGRMVGPVHSLDIRSAYPFAISQLPSLQHGSWHYVEKPATIKRFGVYHVRLDRGGGGSFDKNPGPLFHRDSKSNITFPWLTEGWYWSPEAHLVSGAHGVSITEGWEFVDHGERPFAWVEDVYDIRREWKAVHNSSEYALKILLNSMYGKMAQRVGYNPEKGRLPRFHQLEWAGWVTSYTRAKLFGIMQQIEWPKLLAVETDGLYTTQDPATLTGLDVGVNLGQWEQDAYDEVIYIQSGLAWMRKGEQWTAKRRGLDPDTFQLHHAQEFVKLLKPSERWPKFSGSQTRFITLGAAIAQARASDGKLKKRHAVWETTTKQVSAAGGKRVHSHKMCSACDAGATAWEMPHDLVVMSMAGNHEHSFAHSIPWEGQDDDSADDGWWRHDKEAEGEPWRG